MARSLRLRLHEWLADHIKWVQYPGVQDVEARRYHWKTPMPPEQRIFIATISSIAVVALVALIIAMLIVVWAFFSSL